MGGRPEKPIDWDMVDELLCHGCDGTEISPLFNLHPETFYTRFQSYHGTGLTGYMASKKKEGDSILKSKQFKKAISGDGDNTMLIWLGKQRLNQRENHDRVEIHPNEKVNEAQIAWVKAQVTIEEQSKQIKELEAKLNASIQKTDRLDQPSDQTI